MLHIFPTRLNQYRGIPVATSAINTLHDIDDILKLEKQSVKENSSHSGVIYRAKGELDMGEVLKGGGEKRTTEERQKYYRDVQGAELMVLDDGDQYSQIDNSRPSQVWQGFMGWLCEMVCSSTGIPASVVLGGKVGGADTRRDLATAERVIVKWQGMFASQLQRIYEYVILTFINQGVLKNAPKDWNNAKWNYPPRASVDAGRDAANDRNDVAACLMSMETHFAKRGLNWQTEVDQKIKETAYIKEMCERQGISPSDVNNAIKQAFAPITPASAGSVAPTEASKLTARCKPNQCYHKWSKGGSGKKRGGKGKEGNSKEKRYGSLKEKLVKSKDAFSRINNAKGEVVKASDGVDSIFNSQSVKHVVKDHSKMVGKIRMEELAIAQDTTQTGKHFNSLNKGKSQTEFIKDYNIGSEKKYYYTARRGEDKVVYSWHELTKSNYARKLAEWEKQRGDK